MQTSRLIKTVLPLVLFIGLAVFLAIGLTKDPSLVPSPFIDKAAPAFTLPALLDEKNVSNIEFISDKKGFTLLNVWASWCPGCWREHGFLMALAETGITIIGLNYKDENDKAKAMLTKVGNPFAAIAVDSDGKVGIDYGVYGAPETFIISNQGTILYKHIGGLDQQIWQTELLPVIQKYMDN